MELNNARDPRLTRQESQTPWNGEWVAIGHDGTKPPYTKVKRDCTHSGQQARNECKDTPDHRLRQ